MESSLATFRKEEFDPHGYSAEEHPRDSKYDEIENQIQEKVQDSSISNYKPENRDRAEILQTFSEIAEQLESVLSENEPAQEEDNLLGENSGIYECILKNHKIDFYLLIKSNLYSRFYEKRLF